MPIYEYRCEACGHELEALQKMADAPLTECPACLAPRLTKLVSAAGFQLKGTGWYQTDFRGKARQQDAAPAPDGAASGTACTPAGCEKPGCASKPDAA